MHFCLRNQCSGGDTPSSSPGRHVRRRLDATFDYSPGHSTGNGGGVPKRPSVKGAPDKGVATVKGGLSDVF